MNEKPAEREDLVYFMEKFARDPSETNYKHVTSLMSLYMDWWWGVQINPLTFERTRLHHEGRSD